jgi:dihydrofolate synthase/folylpolyglutamate synthase
LIAPVHRSADDQAPGPIHTRPRSLGEWLTYLEKIHPAEIELGLSRVASVARSMDLLPFPASVVMVAGTNGKGSVVYCCEALLRSAGLRTGRYTSPHIHSFNERIAVDGVSVDDARILAAFEAIDAARADTTLTYFEFATLAALWVFRDDGVDAAVLEIGLGGRLDAVNIVDCDVAVVTAIDLDHQNWLGDTLELIAPEKAAIARAGRPVILAEEVYPSTLFDTLQEVGAVELRAGREWTWMSSGEQLTVQLAGAATPLSFPVPSGLRPANTAAAIQAAAEVLGEAFDPQLGAAALAELEVPGRRQLLSVLDRQLLFDVAHNPAAMAALQDFLQAHPIAGQTVAALGLMADKDLDGMVELLAGAVDGALALAIPGIDRAERPECIWRALDEAGIACPQAEFSPAAVWEQLMSRTHAGDRIVVCGSFHSVAGIMLALNNQLASLPPSALESGG